MARTRILVALIAAAAVALAGCGSESGDNESGGDTGELTWKDSPLSKVLDPIVGGVSSTATLEEQEAYWAEQQREIEELIATCMAGEGFEYIPNIPVVNSQPRPVDDTETMWRPDDRDWVERYGYGLMNNPYREQDPDPAPEPEPPMSVDPNQAYYESLTEAEQRAWVEALHGPLAQLPGDSPPEEAPSDDSSVPDWTQRGCYGRANHEVEGEDPWAVDENKPLVDAMTKFWDTVDDDPAFVQLEADWAGCMAEAGFDGFGKQREAYESISDLMEKYWEAIDGEGQSDPNAGTLRDPEFATIADREIPLALADLSCREKTDYDQQQLRIQFAAEAQFIADHREELDAAKARAEQNRK